MAKTTRIRRFPIPTRKYPPRRAIPGPEWRFASWRRAKVAMGLAMLALVSGACFIVPSIVECDALTMDVGARLLGPSAEHWLGTDQFGRDIGCRILHGGRISLPVGVVAMLTAALPGLCLGLAAGYYGGWVDVIVGRLAEVLLAFPGMLLALLVVAWLGPSLGNAVLAVGLTGIPRYLQITRSGTVRLRRAWFVRAARVVGCTDVRILVRHLLPNVLPGIVALATLDIAWAILNAAMLGFLGLGVQPPVPEWGAMINEGRGFLRQAPWMSLAPSAMMTLTVLAINALGDGLRDALDPRH
jgi:peptide/nickel transport system permease protein